MSKDTKRGTLVGVAAIALALLALTCAVAGAQPAAESNEYRVPEGKTVEGDVMVEHRDVYVAGKVKGSLTVTGGEVRLCSGSEVTGDLAVYGGKLQRDEGAKVGGSVTVLPASEAPAPKPAEPPTSERRIVVVTRPRDGGALAGSSEPPPAAAVRPGAGGLEGAPSRTPLAIAVRAGDVVRCGGPIKIGADEVVEGDVSAFGGPVDIEGEVHGDVAAFGGPVTVSGKVTGDVVVTGGPLDLKDGARIDGDAVAIGGPLHRGANVTIGGNTSSLGGPVFKLPLGALSAFTPRVSAHRHTWVDGLLGGMAAVIAWVVSMLMLMLLGGLVTLIVPRATNTVANKIEEEPMRAAIFGVVGWLLLLPVLFVLAVLIVTSILIPFVLLAFVLLLLVGCVGACLYGGRRLACLLNWRITSLALFTVIGLGALHVAGLVSLLPYGGVLFGLLIAALLVMGLGGALMTRFGTDPTGTWLGRRFNHIHPAPAATPTPPAGDAPTPKAPEDEHDLDEKTLGALKELPPEEGDGEE
ncbi:MAG: polymer-forming cytoskeletal protein [Armatimonadetes bacterium]|nr:polymer-forming cytoskeletal protein [Armatimonadota bacterium]